MRKGKSVLLFNSNLQASDKNVHTNHRSRKKMRERENMYARVNDTV